MSVILEPKGKQKDAHGCHTNGCHNRAPRFIRTCRCDACRAPEPRNRTVRGIWSRCNCVRFRGITAAVGVLFSSRDSAGLSFDQEIPHHSTFSKNRHGRFHESDLFQQLFEEIVDRCQEAGLVEGEHLSVDGSFIAANASRSSRIPREQLAEAAQVKLTIREYLTELEQQNPIEEPTHQQALVSTTDPDSTYATKGSRAAELGYFNNYLIDNQSGVIVGVQATAARLSQESVAAREMITRSAERRGHFPQSVAADTTYGNGELLAWLEQRGITPYIRVKESPAPKTNLYGIEKFTYVAETNSYQCPEGKRLTYVGINAINRTHVYVATRKRCRDCPQKAQCTRGHYRQIAIHVHEAARQRARSERPFRLSRQRNANAGK